MSARTSQLQIRVTPAEKEALKRLARASGRSVSAYVLSQALPSVGREMAEAVGELSAGEPGLASTAGLWTLLRRLRPEELLSPAARPRLSDLAPRTQNLVAALVEEAAYEKGLDPPDWVEDVPPLDRPHFAWTLESLKPHQLRVTPAPFKRRNLFFDPASRPGGELSQSGPPTVMEAASQPVRRLLALRGELAHLELDVEFYIVGGAFMYQAFHARPPTAHVSAMFDRPQPVQEAATRVATRQGWPYDWLSSAVKGYLTARPGRFLELPGLRAFVPRLAYALAIKVAALRVGREPRLVDDVRYLLRAGNVNGTEEAYSLVTPYFAERQLAPASNEVLEEILGH